MSILTARRKMQRGGSLLHSSWSRLPEVFFRSEFTVSGSDSVWPAGKYSRGIPPQKLQ